MQLRKRQAVTEFGLEVLREQSTPDIDPHSVFRSAGTRVCSLGNDLTVQIRKGCLEAPLIILLNPDHPSMHSHICSLSCWSYGWVSAGRPTDRIC